jgi:hypothetical protein
MLDVAFALQHNTTAIFNKGMLFSHHNAELSKILDVQRSGQIPQLVAEQGTKKALDSDVLTMFNQCKVIEGFAEPGYVDWYKVEELGAKGKYPVEKKAQAAQHGVPGLSKVKQEVAAVKQGIAAKAAEEEALAMVQVFPGQFIKKVKREKA